MDVYPSVLSGTRRFVEVVFSLTNRTTDVVERLFTRVDVTEQFPFLVTKLSLHSISARNFEIKTEGGNNERGQASRFYGRSVSWCGEE